MGKRGRKPKPKLTWDKLKLLRTPNEDGSFNIDKILRKWIDPNNGEIQYQVRWAGYTKKYDSWEPISGLPDDVVNDFENECQSKRKRRAEKNLSKKYGTKNKRLRFEKDDTEETMDKENKEPPCYEEDLVMLFQSPTSQYCKNLSQQHPSEETTQSSNSSPKEAILDSDLPSVLEAITNMDDFAARELENILQQDSLKNEYDQTMDFRLKDAEEYIKECALVKVVENEVDADPSLMDDSKLKLMIPSEMIVEDRGNIAPRFHRPILIDTEIFYIVKWPFDDNYYFLESSIARKEYTASLVEFCCQEFSEFMDSNQDKKIEWGHEKQLPIKPSVAMKDS